MDKKPEDLILLTDCSEGVERPMLVERDQITVLGPEGDYTLIQVLVPKTFWIKETPEEIKAAERARP